MKSALFHRIVFVPVNVTQTMAEYLELRVYVNQQTAEQAVVNGVCRGADQGGYDMVDGRGDVTQRRGMVER